VEELKSNAIQHNKRIRVQAWHGGSGLVISALRRIKFKTSLGKISETLSQTGEGEMRVWLKW
jgi:hypothetical protein